MSSSAKSTKGSVYEQNIQAQEERRQAKADAAEKKRRTIVAPKTAPVKLPSKIEAAKARREAAKKQMSDVSSTPAVEAPKKKKRFDDDDLDLFQVVDDLGLQEELARAEQRARSSAPVPAIAVETKVECSSEAKAPLEEEIKPMLVVALPKGTAQKTKDNVARRTAKDQAAVAKKIAEVRKEKQQKKKEEEMKEHNRNEKVVLKERRAQRDAKVSGERWNDVPTKAKKEPTVVRNPPKVEDNDKYSKEEKRQFREMAQRHKNHKRDVRKARREEVLMNRKKNEINVISQAKEVAFTNWSVRKSLGDVVDSAVKTFSKPLPSWRDLGVNNDVVWSEGPLSLQAKSLIGDQLFEAGTYVWKFVRTIKAIKLAREPEVRKTLAITWLESLGVKTIEATIIATMLKGFYAPAPVSYRSQALSDEIDKIGDILEYTFDSMFADSVKTLFLCGAAMELFPIETARDIYKWCGASPTAQAPNSDRQTGKINAIQKDGSFRSTTTF